MNENLSRIGTVILEGDIVIFTNLPFSVVSLKYISGTVTYQGTLNLLTVSGATLASVPQTLDSQNFEMTCQNPIDGFIVDATFGVVEIAFSN